MMPLRLGELALREQPPRLGGVVVGDGRLEVLAKRNRLSELAAQPAQQADLGGAVRRRAHRRLENIVYRRSVTKPRRS